MIVLSRAGVSQGQRGIMSHNRPAEEASLALGRALTAVFEPIIRQAVQEALASALQQAGTPQTTKQPLGISADQAAEFAGISRGTFYKEIYPLIRAGQIKSYVEDSYYGELALSNYQPWSGSELARSEYLPTGHRQIYNKHLSN